MIVALPADASHAVSGLSVSLSGVWSSGFEVPGASADAASETPYAIVSTDSDTTYELPEEIDWSRRIEQNRFGILERKVGRKEASLEERAHYRALLKSRRSWIAAQTYLEDYIEEERQKLVLTKLAELQLLLKPVKI